MELNDLSKMQLARVYNRLYSRLGNGGMFGWDWRTLRITNPSMYLLMRSVAWAHDSKKEESPIWTH